MDETCYGSGDIAGAVLGTLICGIALAYLLWWLYKNYWKNRKGSHLVVEDPENAKNDFAFDNPAFKSEQQKKTTSPLDTKWTNKENSLDKRKTVDDSHAGVPIPRIISLRGSDFTGLGIEVCGGLKDGIFIKKVMPQGPAANIVNVGDKITSITIDFRHIVQEDAATILSYASPYNVQLEYVEGKGILPHIGSQSPSTASLTHPLYRSSSQEDFNTIERNARKKLFPNDDGNYPTLKMEQQRLSPSKYLPMVHRENEKKVNGKQSLATDSIQTMSVNIEQNDANARFSSEDDEKKLKFGIRVLPPNVSDKILSGISPNKVQANNENNTNIEYDNKPPPISKRTKNTKQEEMNIEIVSEEFIRNGSINSSGIRRDANGIPQEIPNEMMQAAMAAREHRKSGGALLDSKKGKAPRPPVNGEMNESLDTVDCFGSPTNSKLNFTDNFVSVPLENGKEMSNSSTPKYGQCSDTESQLAGFDEHESDNETASSGTQIELNSKHITVHQTSSEESDNEERRTASLGDLSKFEKPTMPTTNVHSQNGNLERAQSLEMSEGSAHIQSKITPKKRKAIPEIESSEFKEPRLSMDLSNLDTLQRGRLKSSYEWGNLEDAIYDNVNGTRQNDENIDDSKKDSSMTMHVLNASQMNGDVTTKNKKKSEAFSISWDKDDNEIQEIPNNLEDTVKHYIQTDSRNGFLDKAEENGFNNYAFHDEHISISPVHFRSSSHQTDTNPDKSLKVNDSDQIKIINYGTNMPDDVKVSRYPFGSLERPKSDVLKKLASQLTGEDVSTKTITTNSTSKTTIKPSSPTITNLNFSDMQPISLTMVEQTESDLTESSQMSPVFSSDGHGVNSISISSMEVKIRPDSRKDVLPGMLGRENIVTINADGSQPSSIIMIDDEKLDFTLQKLEDDTKPFANNSQNDEVIIIESLSSKKLPESQTNDEVKTFVTEIRVQTPNEELLDDEIDKDDLEALIEAALKNDTSALKCESPLPAYEPMEKSKTPSPTEREYIPRNVEMKFSTSTYESPQRHFEKRHSHIDQIRSAFEKNHNSEIPVLIRKTSSSSSTGSSVQRTSPSKIPVFNSKSNDGSPKNGSVSVTSIKNSSRNPSGK
ncbi:Protein AHNAK2 [Pseudolycoriella hygida]|uniref:Protein AHNAK2 n=1 Tax=Pseudolycoriella hygida TaxID=35572 RepID=A0A9Q0NBZ4_9DIPT|nr:Protein AHNAK2 [Pseudolycoriella hygida]